MRKTYKYTIELIAKDVNEAYETTLNFISENPQYVKDKFTISPLNEAEDMTEANHLKMARKLIDQALRTPRSENLETRVTLIRQSLDAIISHLEAEG